MIKSFWNILLLLVCLDMACSQSLTPFLQIVSPDILPEQVSPVIVQNGQLNQYFDDSVFSSGLNCRNNNLQILESNETQLTIQFHYQNIALSIVDQIKIAVTPNEQPYPQAQDVNGTHFSIRFMCQGPYSARNYWNQIKVLLPDGVKFSFLLNCDPGSRHKQFEAGYILISLINAALIVGVAMHSYAWSIKINLTPLRFQLKWVPFLVVSIVGDIFIALLLRLSPRDSSVAFDVMRYLGIVLAMPCVFLCWNELFYLVRQLQKPVWKWLRRCDLISITLTVVVIILAFFFENWLFYDYMAICMCIAGIKILHFNSLRQAFSSMTIMFLSVTVLGSLLHFILPRSYNDYAGELASPFFLQVPDLIENLFKKCSWLPIIDVVIPGVTLSYLRLYDENRSSKWGGVYTLSGNLTFVLATAAWVAIQFVYPFSVPFSLITYPTLMLAIFVVAWKRSEWDTLFSGEFIQQLNLIDKKVLEESRQSFREHVTRDDLQDLLAKDEDNRHNSSIIEE